MSQWQPNELQRAAVLDPDIDLIAEAQVRAEVAAQFREHYRQTRDPELLEAAEDMMAAAEWYLTGVEP